jgi:hypothetical protein
VPIRRCGTHGGFQLGKVYTPEVAQATLARVEQVQERFNAFSLIDADAALAIAKESTARWRSGAPHLAVRLALNDDRGLVRCRQAFENFFLDVHSKNVCTSLGLAGSPEKLNILGRSAVIRGIPVDRRFKWE